MHDTEHHQRRQSTGSFPVHLQIHDSVVDTALKKVLLAETLQGQLQIQTQSQNLNKRRLHEQLFPAVAIRLTLYKLN